MFKSLFPLHLTPWFARGFFFFRMEKYLEDCETPIETGLPAMRPRRALPRSRKCSKAGLPARRLLWSLPDVSPDIWYAHHEDSGSYRCGNFIRKAAPQTRRRAHRRPSVGRGLGLLRRTSTARKPQRLGVHQDGSSPAPAPAKKGGAVKGAAKGAAGGAAVGAIAGDAGEGAAIGATVGAVKGRKDQKKEAAAAQQQAQQQAQAAGQAQLDQFKKGFSACMEGKGYTAK
jgi:hypothetical protein